LLKNKQPLPFKSAKFTGRFHPILGDFMLKQRKTQIWLGLTALGALSLGAAIPLLKWHEQRQQSSPIATITAADSTKKQAGAFKALPPAQRTKALEAIVKGKESPERSRARYLLAAELLEQGQVGNQLPHTGSSCAETAGESLRADGRSC
jgi:hypothetical protein